MKENRHGKSHCNRFDVYLYLRRSTRYVDCDDTISDFKQDACWYDYGEARNALWRLFGDTANSVALHTDHYLMDSCLSDDFGRGKTNPDQCLQGNLCQGRNDLFCFDSCDDGKNTLIRIGLDLSVHTERE